VELGRFSWTAIALSGAVSISACDKPPSDRTNAASSATAVSDDDVPVAEDYITKATTEVTEDNYARELDAIEKEINAGE